MTPGTGRWLAPLGASAAVLAVFVGPGVVATAGHGAAGPGLDHRPEVVLTPDAPVTPHLPPDNSDVDRSSSRLVDLTGYRAAGRRLRIYYTVDRTTDCSTLIEPPEVRERTDAVVVRLARRPSRAPDEACAHLQLTSSVDLLLSRPIGERALLDGTRGGALVPVQAPVNPNEIPTPPLSRQGR